MHMSSSGIRNLSTSAQPFGKSGSTVSPGSADPPSQYLEATIVSGRYALSLDGILAEATDADVLCDYIYTLIRVLRAIIYVVIFFQLERERCSRIVL